ncbi:TPA: phage baseplate protein [Escherichia coli]
MDILSAIFRLQSRKIGIFVPDVVVSEKHVDALEITEHPVEFGAAINDHAYKRASEVTMECGFAGGGSVLDLVNLSSIGLRVGESPREIYQQLLDLQQSRVPFDVVTGKRTYSNMLIRAIEVTTDRTSENVLSCVLTLREVIMSDTQSITVTDKANMQEGVSTAPVQNTGMKSLVPTSSSSVIQKIADFARGS